MIEIKTAITFGNGTTGISHLVDEQGVGLIGFREIEQGEIGGSNGNQPICEDAVFLVFNNIAGLDVLLNAIESVKDEMIEFEREKMQSEADENGFCF